MSSFNPSLFVGSASSARSSVRDAIQSYRRAQYLVAGSTVANSEGVEHDYDEDEESQLSFREEDEQDSDVEDVVPSRPGKARRGDSFIGEFGWDEESSATTSGDQQLSQTLRPQRSFPASLIQEGRTRPYAPSPLAGSPSQGEDTPLLSKKVSFSTLVHPRRSGEAVISPKGGIDSPVGETTYQAVNSNPSRRRLSTTSALSSNKAFQRHSGGQSTFGQTLFNSIAILLGIGMLSEPLAFAYSGWLAGTFLIISYGFVSCYTAKILAKIILSDYRLRSYSDIGRKAFGAKVTPFISFMFCLELFAVSVVLITLYGDSLHSLIPQHSSNTFKIWGTLLLIPTVFLPLSLLSYTSILGIMSTILLVFVIMVDGFTKVDAPGSLWVPAETDIGVKSYKHLGVAFGLFMAGFSGHAVIPSLARDMVDPTRFDTMINWAFVVATCIYTVIGYAGYRMFGNNVSDEISVDLLATPGYNPFLNNLCLWMLVLSPLSKFALNTQPLNATIEILLGIDTPISSPEDLADKPDGLSVAPAGSHFGWKRALGILQRICLTTLAVAVSVLVPEFSSMMAFLGSVSAFLLSIIGPILAKVMIEGKCGVVDGVLIAVGVVMAVWGTLAAIFT